MEQIIILSLSAFILGGVAFYFFQKKKWEKQNRQNRFMIEEEKKIINKQNAKIKELEKMEFLLIQSQKVMSHFIQSLEVESRESLTKKNELEYIAARSGMSKMDDGILFTMIQNKHKFARTLLANWLPYGMELGKIALIEKLKKNL